MNIPALQLDAVKQTVNKLEEGDVKVKVKFIKMRTKKKIGQNFLLCLFLFVFGGFLGEKVVCLFCGGELVIFH